MTSATPAPEPAAAGIRIESGNPGPEEIAAITAVLAAALEELSTEHGRQDADATSAWDRSRRGLRRPLVRGAWRPGMR